MELTIFIFDFCTDLAIRLLAAESLIRFILFKQSFTSERETIELEIDGKREELEMNCITFKGQELLLALGLGFAAYYFS